MGNSFHYNMGGCCGSAVDADVGNPALTGEETTPGVMFRWAKLHERPSVRRRRSLLSKSRVRKRRSSSSLTSTCSSNSTSLGTVEALLSPCAEKNCLPRYTGLKILNEMSDHVDDSCGIVLNLARLDLKTSVRTKPPGPFALPPLQLDPVIWEGAPIPECKLPASVRRKRRESKHLSLANSRSRESTQTVHPAGNSFAQTSFRSKKVTPPKRRQQQMTELQALLPNQDRLSREISEARMPYFSGGSGRSATIASCRSFDDSTPSISQDPSTSMSVDYPQRRLSALGHQQSRPLDQAQQTVAYPEYNGSSKASQKRFDIMEPLLHQRGMAMEHRECRS